MGEEMKAFENGIWEIVERQIGKKSVGCTWIYTMKHKRYGTHDWYKARLLGKWYT